MTAAATPRLREILVSISLVATVACIVLGVWEFIVWKFGFAKSAFANASAMLERSCSGKTCVVASDILDRICRCQWLVGRCRYRLRLGGCLQPVAQSETCLVPIRHPVADGSNRRHCTVADYLEWVHVPHCCHRYSNCLSVSDRQQRDGWVAEHETGYERPISLVWSRTLEAFAAFADSIFGQSSNARHKDQQRIGSDWRHRGGVFCRK